MLLDMALLVTLVEGFAWSYLASNICAFLVVNVLNYIISRKWVFESTGIKRRYEFPTFLFFVTVGLAINQVTLWYLVESWDIDYRLAKIFATVVIVAWNFFTRKYLVFGLLAKLLVKPESSI